MNPDEVIRRAIGSGEENAVPCKALEVLTGLSGREVKRCIEELRRRAYSIRRTLESAEALFDKWNELQNR